MLSISLLFVCCLTIHATNGEITFRNGRHKEGFQRVVLSKADKTLKFANPNVKVKWFTQKLDHFHDDSRTWMQKYWVNDQFYKPGGPIFVNIGGEGPTSISWIDPNDVGGDHDWLLNAERFRALCIQFEHRYYGDSFPTSDLATDNLQWLSSRQALADLANFIPAINTAYEIADPKWVTFGGSYSGAMSAWFRLKYPHLAVGAIATSGPVQAQVDFKEYMGVVKDSLESFDPECLAVVRNATTIIESMIASENGMTDLDTKFDNCLPLSKASTLDITNFYNNLAQTFAGVVQYSNDNRGSAATTDNIPYICNMLTSDSSRPIIDRYSDVIKFLSGGCFDYSYDGFIKYIQNTARGATMGFRQWIYQTCTEFGYYQGSEMPGQPFGDHFPLKFQVQQCADIFGPEFTSDYVNKAIDETNTYYGGRDIQESNIVLPNGSLDPWHALGKLTTTNPRSPAVFITGTAHCANMYPPRAADLTGLVEAREIITSSIASWLLE